MNKTPKNQKGFTVVETLLVIVVLAGIGLGGYLVWHAQHKPGSPKTVAKSTSTAATTATTAKEYLTIKEWGVRIPIPGDANMADIYYVHYPGENINLAVDSSVSFGSHKLDAITANSPDCTPQANNFKSFSPFGYIDRMTPAAYKQASQDETTGVSGGVLFNSYYYVWLQAEGSGNVVSSCNPYEDSKITAGLNKLTDNGTKTIDNFPDIGNLLQNIQAVPKP